MKRFPLFVCLLVVVIAVAAWLASGWIVARLTRDRLPLVRAAAAQANVDVRELDFASARVTVAPIGVRWEGWRATLAPPATRRRPAPEPIAAAVKRVAVDLAGWRPLTIRAHLEGLELGDGLDPDLNGEEHPFDAVDLGLPITGLSEGRLELPPLALAAAPARIDAWRREFAALVTNGTVDTDLSFSARLHFRYGTHDLSARLRTEPTAAGVRVRLVRDDLNALLPYLDRRLTPAEQDLVVDWPLRTPTLLRIVAYAENLAARLAALDPLYEEDATRHIIWSYWLTRRFGPEFAELVTEAHEIGSDNDPAESARDRHHNALGRRYATRGLSENAMLQAIRSDPQVRRLR